ncbi:hypothetical protein INR49_014634 [Caranx melampygus]|nr:hypothetical protein INR49_014634 [Caranx melampygus]
MMSSMLNVTSTFHLLPTCDSCLVFSINTTASNLSSLSKFLNMTTPIGDEEITAHSLYLLGKESTMKDSDIEKFKQQASCFGFSKEPDFNSVLRARASGYTNSPVPAETKKSRMCCVVKQAALLLLLLAVANYSPVQAADDCEGVNTPLPAKDLHKIYGDWVLVWSVADHQQAWDLLPHVSSSHAEFQLLPDNNTIMFSELNLHNGKNCSNYIINMSMPSDPTSDEHHPLVTIAATVQEEDGVVKPYNDSGVMYMYVSCPDCLTMVYRNVQGQFLLIYRREGHHSDVEQLKAAHDGYRKKAECLNIPTTNRSSMTVWQIFVK